jgi:hypothetical protein
VAVRKPERQSTIAAPPRGTDQPLALELRELLEGMLLLIV